MNDKEVEAHKRRLQILREKAAKYGNFIDETLSPNASCSITPVDIKSGVTKVAIISAGMATLTTLFVIWSYTRLPSLELLIAEFAFGLAMGMLMGVVIE